MDIKITNNWQHPEYIEALKEMDDAYRVFLAAREKAAESANGADHYNSGMDERLFNRFLEKKKIVEELGSKF